MVPAHPFPGSRAETAPSPFPLTGCSLWVWRWCGGPPAGGPCCTAAISPTASSPATQEGFPVSVTAVYRRLCRALQAGLARLGLQTSPGAPQTDNLSNLIVLPGWAAAISPGRGKSLWAAPRPGREAPFCSMAPSCSLPRRQPGGASRMPQNGTPPLRSSPWQKFWGHAPPLDLLKEALLQGFQEELGLTLSPGGPDSLGTGAVACRTGGN